MEVAPYTETQQTFCYRTLFVPELAREEKAVLCKDVSAAAINGFGMGFASPEVIDEMLTKEPHLVYATNGTGDIVGFQMQRVFDRSGHRVLYYSRAIKKDHQGHSLARGMLHEAVNKLRPTAVGARSQNPAEMLSFLKAVRSFGARAIYPFEHAFHSDPHATTLLSGIVTELQGHSRNVNLRTGVMARAFDIGKLGDYQVRTEHPQIATIEELLQTHGLQRENGDAQYYFALL